MKKAPNHYRVTPFDNGNFMQIYSYYAICFVLERPSEPDSCVKVRRLLEVESDLVNEYAGDIRSKINATAG